MSQQSPQQQTEERRTEPLVAYLTRLHRDGELGPLAELRRGAGDFPDCGARVLRHVAPLFPREPNIVRENALILVATLFALNPTKGDTGGNIGEVLRRTGGARDSDKSTERRFLALLGADRDELPTHLRHAVSIAAASGVPVCWSQLLEDVQHLLSGTEWRRQRVVRQWSRSFWARADDRDEAQALAEESTT